MHMLGSFLNWLMPTLTAWMVSFFTRKIAVATATVAAFVLLTASFLVVIKQIVLAVMTLAVMPAWITYSIGLFIPANFSVVLSNILAAQACRWAFDKAREKIALINSAQ